MQRIVTGAMVAASMLAMTWVAGADQTANWQIDPNHSVATFNVVHMGLSHVEGHFPKVSGGGYWNGKDYSDATLDVTIDAGSVDTRVANRDKDLVSDHFLDVAQFPTMTFKSRRIRDKGNGHVEVLGDLTIHGVTKGVILDTTVTGPIKDMGGKPRLGAHATATINRKDFGLTWNKTLDNGNVVVADNVDITLDAELVQASP